MKKLKIIAIAALLFIAVSCNKEDNATSNTDTSIEVENITNQTVNGMALNIYKPKSGLVKGIVVLGSGNNPQDPTPGDLNDSYLINISKNLAAKGYTCAIVQYRDQPYVGANFENFNSNAARLVADFNEVGNSLRLASNLGRNKLIFGGSSYAANCLISHNAWGNNMVDIKGVIGIMGSCSLDTAKSQKVPVLTFACAGEPFGTHYGNSIVQNITNTSVKNNSFGFTDTNCSGHATSINWIPSITEKVMLWLP